MSDYRFTNEKDRAEAELRWAKKIMREHNYEYYAEDEELSRVELAFIVGGGSGLVSGVVLGVALALLLW